MKISGATGEVLWSGFWGPSEAWNESAFALAVDSQGDLIAAGRQVIEGNGDDFLVVKFDGDDGSLIWNYSLDGTPGLDDCVWDILCDADDNIFATGVAFDGDGEALFCTFKLDPEGGQVWVREETGAVQNATRAGWLGLDDAGNVIMANRSWVSGQAYNVELRKYASADGETIWSAEYDSPEHGTDDPRWMCLDARGDVLVTGVSNSNYMTLKFAGDDGSLIWTADYDGPPGWYDLANFVMVGAGSTVYVTGFSDGGSSGWDVLIQAIDGDLGEELWTLRHNGPDDLTDEGVRMVMSGMGDLYLVGYSYFFATDQDQLAIRYAPDSTDLPADIAAGAGLSAWPNPFRGISTLRLSLDRDSSLVIGIFDLEGRRVRQLAGGEFQGGENLLAWDGRDDAGRDLPAGMYFARAAGTAGVSESTKLMLLK